MGVCILLVLPCLLIVLRLRDLYRNTEPYTGIDYGLAASRRLAGAAASGQSTPRHRRAFSAFVTDTYDTSYRQRHKLSAREMRLVGDGS